MEQKAKTVKESQVELIHLSSPNDANIAGKVHGGILMKLIDEAAYATASKHAGHACVTASVNRTDFFHPIHIGDLITIKASVNYVGKTSMDIGVKVESQNLRTGEMTRTTSSYLTLVALDDRGKPVKIPALIAETEEEKKWFRRGERRYRERKKRGC